MEKAVHMEKMLSMFLLVLLLLCAIEKQGTRSAAKH